MIAITNGTKNGNTYPATFSGTISINAVKSGGIYELDIDGLTDNNFTAEVEEELVETSGSFDSEKAAYWLMEQVQDAANATNISSDQLGISFSESSSSGNDYELDVSGSYKVVFNSESNDVFDLTIKGLEDDKYDVEIDVDDAGGNSSAPDPGDVFRTLMKWLKELLCPHCL